MLYLDSSIRTKIFCTVVGSEVIYISRTTADLIYMVACVQLLLVQIEKQFSECVFRKHFKPFHKFADTANEFIKLSTL